MVNTYTSRLKKRLPGAGDPNWDDEWHDNEKIDEVVIGALLGDDRVISGGAVTDGGGLTANHEAIVIRLNGENLSIDAGSLAMTATQANWLYVNASGVVVTSLTLPSGDYIPLALVDTDSASILRIADLRPMAEVVELNKDLPDGVPGLTGLLINFMNALGTIKSFFANANTVARTYTFQDRDGTIADDTDLTAVNEALDGKASLNSPALTDTPTAPTADPGTNNTQIATTAFVAAAVAAASSANTHNDIIGGDVTVVGNTLTITPCGCWDSTRAIWLETLANTQVTLPSTQNQDFFVFIVRLTGEAFEPRAYLSLSGPESDNQIIAWRQISYAKNTGAGVTMPFIQTGNFIFFTDATTNRPFIAGLTTSYVSYSISAAIPVGIVKSLGIMPYPLNGTIFLSLDGANPLQNSGYNAYNMTKIPPVASIYMKYANNVTSAYVHYLNLWR